MVAKAFSQGGIKIRQSERGRGGGRENMWELEFLRAKARTLKQFAG
jgi:hypothetical protein